MEGGLFHVRNSAVHPKLLNNIPTYMYLRMCTIYPGRTQTQDSWLFDEQAQQLLNSRLTLSQSLKHYQDIIM